MSYHRYNQYKTYHVSHVVITVLFSFINFIKDLFLYLITCLWKSAENFYYKYTTFTCIVLFNVSFIATFMLSIAFLAPDSDAAEILYGRINNFPGEYNLEIVEETSSGNISHLHSVLDSQTFYRVSLNKESRQIYDRIHSAVLARDKCVNIGRGYSLSQINYIITLLLCDHVELFWFEGTSNYNRFNGNLYLHYALNEKEIALVQYDIEKIAMQVKNEVQQFNEEYYNNFGYDYPLIEHCYSSIISKCLSENTEYNREAKNNQNAYSVFVNKESVCAGHAKAYVYLMRYFNIPAIYVYGSVDKNYTDYFNNRHAWNIARVDEHIVYTDVTWYDTSGGNDYYINSYFAFTTHEAFLECLMPDSV